MSRIYFLLCLFIVGTILCGQSKIPGEQVLNDARKKQLKINIKALDRWPLSSAKKTAANILEEGEITIPFLLDTLSKGKSSQKAAIAFCLGKLKAEESFADIEKLCHQREMLSHMRTLFTALVRINQEKAYPVLVGFLQSGRMAGSYPAFRILQGITQEKHLTILNTLMKSQHSDTRKYTLQLIAQTRHKKALDILIKSLGDNSPKVAKEASMILGRQEGERASQKLLSLHSHHDKRMKGYAILALIEQEDRFKKELFTEKWIPVLLLALRHDEYFIRGTAAVALVNIGFYSNNPEIAELMDKTLAPLLIDIISGKVFFQDYVSLRNIAYQKLKQLTGKNLGNNTNDWWKWWDVNKDSFRAIRLMQGITSQELRQMVIQYKCHGVPNSRHWQLYASPAKVTQKEIRDKTAIILQYRQMADLLNILKQVEFFKLPAQIGNSKKQGAYHMLQLEVPYSVKKIEIHGQNITKVKPIIEKMETLIEENQWQFYWDSYHYPEWKEWYLEQSIWFSGKQTKRSRHRRIKTLILTSYAWLRTEQREKAAQHFFQLMEKDSWLSISNIDLLLLHIQSEKGIPQRSEYLIKSLALSNDLRAANLLIQFLAKYYSAQARKLLLFTFEQLPDNLLMQYLQHPDPHLRSVTAEILGNKESNETNILYLLVLLKEKNVEIRQTALSSLGKLRAKIAWEPIYQIAQDRKEAFEIRHSALIALAQISKKKAVPVLLENLGQSDSRMRSVIAQALGEIKNKTAVQTLLALFRDPSPQVRQTAANSLITIRSKRVVRTLLQICIQKGPVEQRILAIRTLAKIAQVNKSKKFATLLKERDSELRCEAALALAKYYDFRVIPVLIEELTNRSYGFTIRKQLEKMTLQSYTETDYAAIQVYYRKWWKSHKELSRRQWFFDAVRERGYSVTPLLDYLLGMDNIKIAPLLIELLGDGDWFIRAEACKILNKITDKSFGIIDPYTGTQTTLKIQEAWQNWLMSGPDKDK